MTVEYDEEEIKEILRDYTQEKLLQRGYTACRAEDVVLAASPCEDERDGYDFLARVDIYPPEEE